MLQEGAAGLIGAVNMLTYTGISNLIRLVKNYGWSLQLKSPLKRQTNQPKFPIKNAL